MPHCLCGFMRVRIPSEPPFCFILRAYRLSARTRDFHSRKRISIIRRRATYKAGYNAGFEIGRTVASLSAKG